MSLLRKTTQNPLPVCKPETGKNQYDIYPTHDLGPDKIFCDYTSLARRLAGQKQVVVDGYVGVRFDLFRQELNRALTQLGIRPVWWSVDAALRPQEEIERLVAPYLGGDDPIFGFRTPLRLEEFFDGEKLRAIAPDPEAEMNILVGTGAALAGWQGELVYIDIPKNEIQFRSRAGSIANLGATQPEPPKKMYKRFYFVDWVVLNRHKKELLPRIGRVKLVQCNFSQYSSRYDAFCAGETPVSFDPECAGGALMDLNVYNISYIVGLFGEPNQVHYLANMERGIDTSGILTMEYNSFKAVSMAAKDCGAPARYVIQGTKGYILQKSTANWCGGVTFHPNQGKEEHFNLNGGRPRQAAEFHAFAKAIEGGDQELCSRMLDTSVAVSRVLTVARRSAGIKFPCDK